MTRGFNVSQFRAAIGEDDLLRTNRFLMEFSLPRGLLGTGGINADRTARVTDTVRYLEYYCEALNTPGLNLEVTEGRKYTYGPMQKRPYVTKFNDLNVTFFDDGESKNWQFFLDWIHMINLSPLARTDQAISDGEAISNSLGGSPHYPYELSYRREYITDARILVYGLEAGPYPGHEKPPSRIIYIRDLFPIAISDQALNWTDVNSLLRLTVNFTFLEWYDLPKEIISAQYSKG